MPGGCRCHIDGLVQDCSISIANALELLQSCTKPSIWPIFLMEVIPRLAELQLKFNGGLTELGQTS